VKAEPVRIGGSKNLYIGEKNDGVLITSPSVLSPHHLFVDVVIDLLKRGTTVRFRAIGRSMQPTISEGEIITVEPVEPSQVKRGDIVLYQNHRGVIAHRVVAIEKKSDELPGPPHQSSLVTFFILRGDASGVCDEPVKSQQILGKVVSVERRGHHIHLNSLKAKFLHTARLYVHRFKMRIVRISFCHPFSPPGHNR